MTNFKWHIFSDLYEISSGISTKPEQAGHGEPFVSFSTVFNNMFLPATLPDLMASSNDEQQTYSVKKGDIFLTRTSETIDELGMSSVALKEFQKATYSGFVKRLRPIRENISHEKYMGFYLRSPFFRKTMTNNAVMTLRASLNEEIFSYLKLYLPDYATQKRIGELLHSLYSKTILNTKVNANLEAMAKALFEFWFVQFDFPNPDGKPYKTSGGKMIWNEELKREIPEGWEIKKINSLIKIGSGYPFSSKTYKLNGKHKIITIKNVQDGQLNTANVEKIDDIPANVPNFCKLELGDVLISLTGNVGRMCFVGETNLLLNQRVGKLIADKKYINYGYLFLSRPEQRIRLENMAGGSSQSNLSPIDATEDFMCVPRSDILDSFSELIKPIFTLIVNNNNENKKLSELCDWLLPMLMNGQITVK